MLARGASARHGAGAAQGGQRRRGRTGHRQRAVHRRRRAGCSGRQPPFDRNLSAPVASRTGVGVDGRCPAAGGRRAWSRYATPSSRTLPSGCIAVSTRCTAWRVYEGYEEDFHYHHHNLFDRGGLSGGPRLVLQDIRLAEHEGVGDAVVRSILSRAGRGLRGLVPPRRPFPSPQRCRGERAEPQPSIRLRVASGEGLAAGVGRRVVLVLEGVLPAAGIQHPVALQRGAGIDPLRDSRLAVRARQASRHQRLVDGAGHDRSPASGKDQTGSPPAVRRS